jgi:hypothetical protein
MVQRREKRRWREKINQLIKPLVLIAFACMLLSFISMVLEPMIRVVIGKQGTLEFGPLGVLVALILLFLFLVVFFKFAYSELREMIKAIGEFTGVPVTIGNYNAFLPLAVTASVVVLISGIHFVSIIYAPPPLPNLEFDKAGMYAYSDCTFGEGKDFPVVGGYIYCDAVIRSDEWSIKGVREVDAYHRHYPLEDYPAQTESIKCGETSLTDEGLTIQSMEIPIKKSGSGEVRVAIHVIVQKDDEENDHSFRVALGTISYEALTVDAYNRRQTEKYGLFLAICTLGVFTTISAVKNLRDLWRQE